MHDLNYELKQLCARKAFGWRAGIAVAISTALWALQANNGWFAKNWGYGVIPIAIAVAYAFLAYRRTEERRYSTARVSLTRVQRLRRAEPWWVVGGGILLLFSVSVAIKGTFLEYWWLAAVAVTLTALSGFGIYLLKSETTLTPDAVKARSYFVGLEFQAANERTAKGLGFDRMIDVAIRFIQRPPVRYCLAALCLYAAYGMGIKTLETLGNASFVESFKD